MKKYQAELNNQVAIVTGGLGGLGKAVCSALSQAGATVVMVDRPKQKGAHYFSVDVADTEKVKGIVKAIHKKFKRIDILVNCAGIIGPIGEFHSNDLSKWLNTLNVNFLGTLNFCHAVLPYMAKKKRGKIINIAGGGAVQPFPNFSAYASSKAAVVRFSENLSKEYEDLEINSIAPGVLATKLVDDLLKAGSKKVGKEYFQKTVEDKKRGGDSPEEAANLVVFLASPKSKITGKLISAKWDKWKNLKPAKSSEYTLRRIDNKYFFEIK